MKIGERASVIRVVEGTRIFVFLNCYLLLYCLGMIYIGGLYDDHSSSVNERSHNLKLDNSIFIFTLITIVYLILGWLMDKQLGVQKRKRGTSLSEEEIDRVIDEGEENMKKEDRFVFKNGYYFAATIFLISVVVATLTYYFNWTYWIPFSNHTIHDILILVGVFIPLSNFVIYFIKANRRANLCLPYLVSGVTRKSKEFIGELESIEEYVRTCTYLNRQINVTEENGNKHE